MNGRVILMLIALGNPAVYIRGPAPTLTVRVCMRERAACLDKSPLFLYTFCHESGLQPIPGGECPVA
jgi:hypothetical protein